MSKLMLVQNTTPNPNRKAKHSDKFHTAQQDQASAGAWDGENCSGHRYHLMFPSYRTFRATSAFAGILLCAGVPDVQQALVGTIRALVPFCPQPLE